VSLQPELLQDSANEGAVKWKAGNYFSKLNCNANPKNRRGLCSQPLGNHEPVKENIDQQRVSLRYSYTPDIWHDSFNFTTSSWYNSLVFGGDILRPWYWIGGDKADDNRAELELAWVEWSNAVEPWRVGILGSKAEGKPAAELRQNSQLLSGVQQRVDRRAYGLGIQEYPRQQGGWATAEC